jgi:hypothetical protein
MADESSGGNLPSSKPETGEKNNSMTDDEIGQLSDLISDCMESKDDGEDTGSFTRTSDDEDTGEFKPVQD